MRNIWKTGPIKFKMADLQPLPIDKFSRKSIHSTFFAPKFIPYIARVSLKFGKIQIESRFNMRNIWKAGPIKFKMADLRPLPIDKFSR